MRYFVFGLMAFQLAGQEIAPVGLLRGEIVYVSGSGLIDFRIPAGALYRCSYDTLTFAERKGNRIPMLSLERAEVVEITADRKAGRCYARTVHVLDVKPVVANPGYRVNLRPARGVLDQLFPRGNLTFAGVVLRHSPETLVLRTRSQGEKLLRLRDDTRYLDSGFPTDLAKLVPNTRVFVRAGRNFENEIEVFQVIWGEIAGPASGQR